MAKLEAPRRDLPEHSEDGELLGMVDEGSFGSDDKAHLTSRLFLDQPEDDSSYFRDLQGGTVTYRFVQVSDEQSNHVGDAESATPGQFYVISNSPETFGAHSAHKTMIPRDSGVTKTIKKRDDKRRATHNEVERRRRDKINSWITKLAALVPNTGSQPTDAQSKGGILAKACDYITELTEHKSRHQQCLRDNERLVLEVIKLTKDLTDLQKENAQLKNQLTETSAKPRNSTGKS